MRKRKHRVMVEMTFEQGIDERTAIRCAKVIFENADMDKIIGADPGLDSKGAYLTHIRCKSGERVIAGEKYKKVSTNLKGDL